MKIVFTGKAQDLMDKGIEKALYVNKSLLFGAVFLSLFGVIIGVTTLVLNKPNQDIQSTIAE